jgi:DNA-binding NarL/FixJ family response regulator
VNLHLPTIVVCDTAAGQKEAIESLISEQPSLILLGTVSRQAASQQTLQQGIKVIWLELAPDPQKGLALLHELKEKYPKVHYLVSYETLQADLVKTAMQLGAVEYLDMPGASRLLAPAIARINQKEQTATTGASNAPPAPLASSRPSATYDNLQALPAGQGSIAQGRTEKQIHTAPAERVSNSSLRKARALTTEGDPNSIFAALPSWLLPSLMIVMVIVVVLVMMTMMQHH